MRLYLFVGLVLWVGCTKPNPRSCGDGSCTDPAFPFCDVEGVLGGTPNECIAVECDASTFEACRGDDAVVCNSTGNNFDLVDCPLGCDATHGCRACETDSQCGNPTPICDGGLTCRACIEDDECPSRVCDEGSCTSEADTVYAANDGSTTADCSLLTPCTVGRAIQLAKAALPQPTIRILPGVYLVGIGLSGATTSRLNIVATGATIGDAISLNVTNGAEVVVRGGELVGSESALSCGQTNTTSSKVTLIDTKLVSGDKTAGVVQVGAACIVSAINSTLTVNDGIALGVVNGGSFGGDRLHITGVRPSIQMLFANVNLSITNSVLEDPQFLFTTIDSTTTSRAYFASNTIVLTSQASRVNCNALDAELTVRFENNIIVGVGTQETSVIEGSDCLFTSNILHPQPNVPPTNLDVDPLFLDLSNQDYRVQATSPAVDAANPTPFAANDHDFVGAIRPQGEGPDIGAFEQ